MSKKKIHFSISNIFVNPRDTANQIYHWMRNYSEIRHGDRPHNYVSNDIFGFAVSLGLMKILLIEKYILFRWHVCCEGGALLDYMVLQNNMPNFWWVVYIYSCEKCRK